MDLKLFFVRSTQEMNYYHDIYHNTAMVHKLSPKEYLTMLP